MARRSWPEPFAAAPHATLLQGNGRRNLGLIFGFGFSIILAIGGRCWILLAKLLGGFVVGDKPWKRAERVAAALFGGLRNPLSGSNSHHTAGDVIHPTLYVEVKHRQRQAAISLMRDTATEAKKERKLPVLVTSEPNGKWSLVCVKSCDLVKLVNILHDQWANEPNIGLLGNILSTDTGIVDHRRPESMRADFEDIGHPPGSAIKPLPEMTKANKGLKKLSRRHS